MVLLSCITRLLRTVCCWRIALVLVCVAPGWVCAQAAAPALDKRALILVSVGFGGPGVDQYVTGLVNGLRKGGIQSRDIYVEYLDLGRSSGSKHRKPLGALLTAQYADVDFDMVFCVQQPALNFLLNEGHGLAKGATVFARDAQVPPRFVAEGRKFVLQTSQLDYAGTLQRALELFPRTENVIVIQGRSEIEQSRQDTIRSAMAPWQGRLHIETTQALSFADIDAKVAAAPQNTILLGSGIAQDGAGEVFVPLESNSRIVKFAKAPFFVLYDASVGSGSVGGMVTVLADDAVRLSAQAIDIARGAKALTDPVTLTPGQPTPMFDWRQLERWGADASVLPPNTVFINRPPTLWSQYKAIVLGSGVVFVLLISFVLVLFFQNRQRRIAEARYRILVEEAPEAIVLIDLGYAQAVDANRSAEKLLGCSREELMRGNLSRFYMPIQPDGMATADSTKANVARAKAGESVYAERAIRTADGRELICEVRLVMLPDAQRELLRASIVDVTERRQAETAVIELNARLQALLENFQQLNRELDQRVQDRTEALQASKESLQQMLDKLRQTQDQLVQSEKLAALGSIVAAVAHELNTPIGNCLTVASTMHDKTVAFAAQITSGALRRSDLEGYMQASREAMVLLQRGMQSAAALVSNFKQVAVDQNSAQQRSFDLRDCVAGVVALLQSSLQKKPYRIELAIPHGLTMKSYPGAIEQIVSNLINNSVLHGFEGRNHGAMRIAANEQGDRICIVYSDDGNGMAPAVLSHIFEPFFTTRLGEGGSGLGMSICYNLVTGPLGGRIDVASTLGAGCTVTMVMPREAAAPSSKA